MTFWYGRKQGQKSITLELFDREVTAFIEAPGSGKEHAAGCLNRTNETIPDTRMTGGFYSKAKHPP